MDGQSLNIPEERIEQLRQIFPDVFSEGKIDFNRLKAALGENVLFPGEHYELSWAGKADARREVQRQTTATLIPDVEGSVDFENAQNIFIEGENLEVLRVLQKSYFGKVKMIYIDPPYNTGNDSFVYPDDFAERQEDYLKRTGAKDEAGYLNKQDLWKKNSKENGQFHSVWLSMMYPRLYLARNLMRDDGVIFVSIDETEIADLKLLMNEVFGEENFRGTFVVRRYDKNLNRQFIENGLVSFNTGFEYIVCYAKSEGFTFNPIYKESSENRQNYGYWKGFWNDAERPTMRYEILGFTPESGQWKWRKEKAEVAVENYHKFLKDYSDKMSLEEYWIQAGKKLDFIRRNKEGKGKNRGVEHWIPPTSGILRNTNWTDVFASKIESEIKDLFDYPKNVDLIKMLICLSDGSEEDIILDFFAGSATTAQAVVEFNVSNHTNKKFICVQYPEPYSEDSEAFKQGFRFISDVSKKRIQKVLLKQSNRKNETLNFEKSDANFGLRSFLLRPSNFKIWRSDISGAKSILSELEFLISPEKENSLSFNQATEILLKLGLSLTTQIESKNLKDETYYSLKSNEVVLLLNNISPDLLEHIIELSPKQVICLDSLFQKNDTLKSNWKLQFKENQIQFKTF